MSRSVLIVAMMEGTENFARLLSEHVGAPVEIASSRKDALQALRQGDFGVVVVEEGMVESDPRWADALWAHAGLAMPLQINFAISGSARVAREVKAALGRREEEFSMARRAAAVSLENELKSSVTGLLLESELALRDPSLSAALEPKLRHLVELADSLRERLRSSTAEEAGSGTGGGARAA